jgi:hypothetical protein
MTKFMKIAPTHVLDGFATVSVKPETPMIGELTLTAGDVWHVFQMERRQLELLHHEIASKLKAAPLPARGQ